jgi:membrane protease subunit HflC
MKQAAIGLFVVIFSVIAILTLSSTYVLNETEQAVITQFGEPIGQPITKAGLHFKTPFIQTVNKFEKRILEWDGYPSEIPTKDKKFIWVDPTGRWRIQDPLKFFQTLQNERSAQSRLDDIVDGITRNFVTRYNLADIVRTSNRILEVEVTTDDIRTDTEYEKIDVGRDEITRKILDEARSVVKDLGIELVDLRIKRINYIDRVLLKVFERMISERKRAAEELRSEGMGIKAEVEGRQLKELKRIQSEAYAKAQKLQGQADADATQIYGEAYSSDPEFFAFMSALEKYPTALADGRLVLSTDSDFLKYLKDSGFAS